ncbi:glycosyltransferase family 2 protein [Nocardiopsis sp. JB363]|uniref:glycosyltransferase n=1 Tax=Nocardiopsis sp. JB363 TaxID=1434837 RepID=UPI000B352DB4|nr:glycosyltransferase family 2 protein [Nocardiopsis sp. JB363]
MAVPTPEPLPMGLGVEIDRAVRLTDEGHVLVGGSPPHALRLPAEGVSSVIRWLSGARPDHHHERVLARVLIETGLAHPRPEPTVPGTDTQVVLVGHGGDIDVNELDATLGTLHAEHPHVRVLVVGVSGPAEDLARRHGARVVRGPVEGSAARAVGLFACDAEFVAFLDIGAEPGPGWLHTALGHFADPDVGAVVPRTPAARRCHGNLGMAVAALWALRSDRGADPAPVLPWGHTHRGTGRPAPPNEHGASVPWEPIRALVVRREPARLDPDLGSVAEVDLLWALVERGWSVRYEPRSRVRVPMPVELGAYLGARWESGAAGAPLARRYGRRATGPQVALPALAGVALTAAGRPLAGLTAGAVGAVATAGTLCAGVALPPVDAVRPASVELAHTARTVAREARTTWWPVLAGVAVGGALAWARERAHGDDLRRGRRAGRRALVAGAVLTVPHLASWRRRHGAAVVGPLAWTALSVAGDAACSLGTWWGVVRSGSVAPLVPRSQPPASTTSVESQQVKGGSVVPLRKPASTSFVSRR